MEGDCEHNSNTSGGGTGWAEKHYSLNELGDIRGVSSSCPEPTIETCSGFERFVDAAVVADFLSIRRDEVLKLTREKAIRGYAYRGRQRHVYRYRLSEVSADFATLSNSGDTITAAAPVSRRKKSNG